MNPYKVTGEPVPPNKHDQASTHPFSVATFLLGLFLIIVVEVVKRVSELKNANLRFWAEVEDVGLIILATGVVFIMHDVLAWRSGSSNATTNPRYEHASDDPD